MLNGRVSPPVVAMRLEPEVPQGDSPAPACCGHSRPETPREIVAEHAQMNIHNEIKLIFDMVPMLIFPKQAWMKTARKNAPTLSSISSWVSCRKALSGGLLSPSCPQPVPGWQRRGEPGSGTPVWVSGGLWAQPLSSRPLRSAAGRGLGGRS